MTLSVRDTAAVYSGDVEIQLIAALVWLDSIRKLDLQTSSFTGDRAGLRTYQCLHCFMDLMVPHLGLLRMKIAP